jgi:hypothetical protein
MLHGWVPGFEPGNSASKTASNDGLIIPYFPAPASLVPTAC